jgi:hypothetical protein
MAGHSRFSKKTFRRASDSVLSTGRRPQIGAEARTHDEPHREKVEGFTKDARSSSCRARIACTTPDLQPAVDQQTCASATGSWGQGLFESADQINRTYGDLIDARLVGQADP